jgi:hypothetical protein
VPGAISDAATHPSCGGRSSPAEPLVVTFGSMAGMDPADPCDRLRRGAAIESAMT